MDNFAKNMIGQAMGMMGHMMNGMHDDEFEMMDGHEELDGGNELM